MAPRSDGPVRVAVRHGVAALRPVHVRAARLRPLALRRLPVPEPAAADEDAAVHREL